jgi:hypothetical protein
MENKFQTSFIPKISLDDVGRVKIKTPHNLFSIIAFIMITISLLGSGGVFVYTYIINNKVKVAKEQVIAKEKQFNYGAVEDIVRVDKQLKAGDTLLNNHTAVSKLFGVLQDATLKNLRFTSFDFTYLSSTKVALSMKGQARTFGAVARQVELFAFASSTKQYFKDPLFSDLNLDEKGNVMFSFITTIDPRLITYTP